MGDKADQLAQEMSRFEQEIEVAAPRNGGPKPLFSSGSSLQSVIPPGPPPGAPPVRPPGIPPLRPGPPPGAPPMRGGPPPGAPPMRGGPPPGAPPMRGGPPPGAPPMRPSNPPLMRPAPLMRSVPPQSTPAARSMSHQVLQRPPPHLGAPAMLSQPHVAQAMLVPPASQGASAPLMMPVGTSLPASDVASKPDPGAISKPKPLKVMKMKRDPKKLRMGGGKVWEDHSLDDWDQDDFRIFVGDLGNDVNDDTLARSFSKYHSFLKAKVIRDKYTKKTKGYGFVSFKTPQDFMQAMKEMNGKYIGNRPIKLRKSTWKDCSFEVVKKKQKEKKRLGFR